MLTSAVAFSQTMLDCAQDAEWSNVIKVEKERSELIKKAFKDQVKEEAAQEVAELVAQIQNVDNEIQTLAERHRDELSSGLKDIRQGKHASKAYQANGAR